MSRQCYVCGKKPIMGRRVSIDRRKSSVKKGQKFYITGRPKRKFIPNLQRVRIQTDSGNKRVRVCTSCLKAGKVQKAVIG